MGHNFKRIYGQFKRYFTIQHYYLPVPSTCTHPNWKFDPFSLEEIQRKHKSSIKRLVKDTKVTACVLNNMYTLFTSVTNLYPENTLMRVSPLNPYVYELGL